MEMKMEISIEDIMNMEIENLPPIEVQKNIVENIERLISEGKSEAEAVHLAFSESSIELPTDNHVHLVSEINANTISCIASLAYKLQD